MLGDFSSTDIIGQLIITFIKHLRSTQKDFHRDTFVIQNRHRDDVIARILIGKQLVWAGSDLMDENTPNKTSRKKNRIDVIV